MAALSFSACGSAAAWLPGAEIGCRSRSRSWQPFRRRV